MMRAAGVFPDRMHVVNHFVDLTDTPVKQVPGGPVVYAGRLSAEKGVDLLIEAVGRMGREGRLAIAGDGPQRPALESLAAERAPGRVRFYGRLPRAALHALVREGSVVAVPSRWFENQPMTVLEAFACGVPVVASSLGGLPELVQSEADGLVMPPNDVDALADALTAMLADPDAALRMGASGRRKIEQAFTPDLHLSRLQQVYDAAARHMTNRIGSVA
jgi:glycosyltransferase involved in cell wall biosynthesis